MYFHAIDKKIEFFLVGEPLKIDLFSFHLRGSVEFKNMAAFLWLRWRKPGKGLALLSA